MPNKTTTAYVFVDTSIFLEFRDFDQIDWPSVLKYRDVCLLVAPITLKELESFKNDRQSKRRQSRSKHVTRLIDSIFAAINPGEAAPVPNRRGVRMQLLTSSSDPTDFPGLVPSVQDDHLLASILGWRREHADVDPNDVVLVTDDMSLRNKARARTIPVIRLDEKDRLKDEPTEEERELARVTRKLEKYTTRQPKLALEFEVNGRHGSKLVIELGIIGEVTPDELDSLVEAEGRTTTPPKAAPRVLPDEVDNDDVDEDGPMSDITRLTSQLAAALGSTGFWGISEKERERFETEKLEYLTEYQVYLEVLYGWQCKASLVRRLPLVVVNNGTLPAQDVAVEVMLPNGLQPLYPSDRPRRPRKPSPPTPPRTSMELFQETTRISPLAAGWHGRESVREQPKPVAEYAPRIVLQPFVGARWHIAKLVHHQPVSLDPICISFPSVLGQVEYVLQYRITASELLEPVTGTLTLEVRGISRNFADYVRGDGPASSSEDTDARTTGP